MAKSPNYFITYSFKDESEELAPSRWITKSGATGPQVTALSAAVSAMSSMVQASYSQGFDQLVSSIPGTGRREMKYLVRCHDVVNAQKFSFTIPGVRDATVIIEGTDFVDLALDTQAAALKLAIEACVASNYYDNLVVVDSIEITRGYK